MKNYILALASASILCTILTEILGKESGVSPIIRLLSGIFLTVVLIKPLTNPEWTDLSLDLRDITAQAEAIVQEGEDMAQSEKNRVITQNTEAYILTKAQQLGVDVDAKVELEEGIPVRVQIYGNVSPYTHSVLSVWIEDTLGIPDEEQIWIG